MDSIFIFGLMLVLFGPKKLPEIARQAGKLMMEFRRASNDFRLQMEEELRSAEQADRLKKMETESQVQRAIAASSTTASLPDGSIAQITGDGEVVALPAAQEAVPSILPPSTGETVSTEPPNRYRVEPEPASADERLQESAQVADHAATEEFYAQREAAAGVATNPGTLPEEVETPPIPPKSGIAAMMTEVAPEFGPVEPAPTLQTAVNAKLPGTEMYPETAPMAESDQAPIRHG